MIWTPYQGKVIGGRRFRIVGRLVSLLRVSEDSGFGAGSNNFRRF